LGPTDSPATPGDGINTVQWVSSGWASRGFDPNVPAFTDVAYEKETDGGWAIVEADIYINSEGGSWVLRADPNTTQLGIWNVVLHEVGHALGLGHPCENTTSANVPLCSNDPAFDAVVMNPGYSAARNVLSTDDTAGVCWLYSAGGPCGIDTCAALAICSKDGCQEPCASLLCAAQQVCLDGKCVERTNEPSSSDGTANVGELCLATDSCRRGLGCIDGICRGGPLLIGDLCDNDQQCGSGICLNAGYCAAACRNASECTEPNAQCTDVKQHWGGCKGSLAAMGAACTSSIDCLGNECLTENNQAPICTRQCGEANRDCPDGWYCNEYDGQKVCSTTGPAETGCSCRLHVRNKRHDSLIFFGVASALLVALSRRSIVCSKDKQR